MDAHRQRRDALKHRNGFVVASSSAAAEEHAGVSGGDAVMNNKAFSNSLNNASSFSGGGIRDVNVNDGGVYYQRQHRGGERRTTTTTKASVAKTKSKAKTWFYRYLQIAVIVFLITCSIAFAEFIYERMLFEHSEIKEHPHGKTLFVGAAVAVVACWTMLVVVVVLSY